MRGDTENDLRFEGAPGALGRLRGVLPQLALAAGIFAVAAAPAQAQDTPEAEATRAQQLFDEGLTLADRGRWPAAEEKLRGALELQPENDRARYQLARVLAEQGKVTEATRHLRAIVHASAPDPIIREAATELLETTEPRIGNLIVVLDGAVDGTTLLIDETPVDADEAEDGIAVDPGLHVVSVTDPQGGPLARRRVEVEAGGAAHLELDVAPTPQAAAESLDVASADSAPLDAEDEAITSQWWFWTGIGAVVVGAVLTTVALSVGGEEPTKGDAPPVHVRGNGMGLANGR